MTLSPSIVALSFAAVLCSAPLNAEVVHQSPYEQQVLPNYTVSDREMIFQVANSMDSNVDTYHVDFANRRWTRYDESGLTSGTWTPSEDVHFNASSPKNLFCLAGPWAFVGCVIAVPIVWSSCNSSATASVRRAQRQCQLSGRALEITNSGTCGQGMQSRCIPVMRPPALIEK